MIREELLALTVRQVDDASCGRENLCKLCTMAEIGERIEAAERGEL